MKSLTNALLSIATALNRIAASLETKSLVQPKEISTPVKEMPTTTATTTATAIKTSTNNISYYSDSYSTVHISRQEKNALDRIYRAIKDSGPNPKHHEKIMADIAKKWPTLSSALIALVAAKTQSDKNSLNKSYSEIWNYKGPRKSNG